MKLFQKSKLQKLVLIVTAFLATGSVWVASTVPVAAAGTQLYMSPGTASIQKGSTFSVSLRVSPGTPIDTVNAAVSYDSSMTLQSIDCTGSPLSPFPSCPTSTTSPVSITSAILGGSVSTDTFVARFNFLANAGSGTGTVSVTGNTAYAGNNVATTTSNATISFTTPTTTTPTCGPNQTGTYPNCVTPVSGGTSGSPSAGGSSKGSTPKTNPTPGSASTPAAPATDASATVSNVDVKFTLATFTATSKDPSQVYIQFGTSKDALNQQTALSELGTTHKVSIDPTLLTPGQTYYYVLVSKSPSGTLTQTAVDSFTMNGLTVRIGVFDKNHKPLKGKTVTLHSTPMTATTDSKGFANFTNVIPGSHQLQYTAGGKTYTQQLSVDNKVTTTGDSQTAPVQTVSVVYNLTASNPLAAARWIILGLLLVVLIVAVLLFSQRKVRFAAPSGAPLSMQPVVVGDGKGKGDTIVPVTPSGSTTPATVETAKRLDSIAAPNKPAPGSTVTPVAIDAERKQF